MDQSAVSAQPNNTDGPQPWPRDGVAAFCPTERRQPRVGYTRMERVENIRGKSSELTRRYFQEGLRGVFDVCHEPLPVRMADLLQALDDNEHGASPRR